MPYARLRNRRAGARREGVVLSGAPSPSGRLVVRMIDLHPTVRTWGRSVPGGPVGLNVPTDSVIVGARTTSLRAASDRFFVAPNAAGDTGFRIESVGAGARALLRLADDATDQTADPAWALLRRTNPGQIGLGIAAPNGGYTYTRLFSGGIRHYMRSGMGTSGRNLEFTSGSTDDVTAAALDTSRWLLYKFNSPNPVAWFPTTEGISGGVIIGDDIATPGSAYKLQLNGSTARGALRSTSSMAAWDYADGTKTYIVGLRPAAATGFAPASSFNVYDSSLSAYRFVIGTTGNNGIVLGGNEAQLWDADNSHYVGLKSPALAAAGPVLTLPSALPGAASDIMVGSTTGVLSFFSAAALSIVKGVSVNNRVAVWNGANTLDGSANLTFDGLLLTALQYVRIGTAADAVAQGDFCAGQGGGGRIVWDQSLSILQIFNSSGVESARVHGSTAASRGFYWTGAVSGSNPIAFAMGKTVQGVNTFARTLDSAPTIDAGASVTTFIGANFDNPGGAGTITNCYGIQVAGQTKGGTLNRAIYCAGSADGVEIASYVRVGGSVPAGFASQGDFVAGSSTGYLGYDNDAATLTHRGVFTRLVRVNNDPTVEYVFDGTPTDETKVRIANQVFRAKNSAGTEITFASIEAFSFDTTAGTEDGRLEFYVTRAAVQDHVYLTLNSTEVAVNDGGNDIDVRGEGVNKPNCLLLDASDDEVAIDGRFSLVALTPAQIAADQNDYNPESTATNRSSFWRLSSDASRTVTGIANGLDGRVLILANVGGFDVVLANQNASSAAGNRIITGTGADVTVAADTSVKLIYDNTTARWRVV